MLVLAACGGLALAGGLLHRPALNLAAMALLLLAWLPVAWRRRSLGTWLTWSALALLLLAAAMLGRPELALLTLPVACFALVAWLFARTLRRSAEPLICRCVRVIEGEARLDLPGVRAYTRGVTAFWAGLLMALAAASLVVAMCAPGGWLAAFGVASPVTTPAWYSEAGCWIVLPAAFAGEYLFRRWHLHALPHPPLRQFVIRLVQAWPALVRGEDTPA
jgi:uncharacterized membrane protein